VQLVRALQVITQVAAVQFKTLLAVLLLVVLAVVVLAVSAQTLLLVQV
jgi:hypothetical protein